MCYTQNRFNALLSACVLSLIATAGWSQSLTWLGTLPGRNGSDACGVSADGTVVVGEAYYAPGPKRAFRWTASGGMQDLGSLGSNESRAYDVSANGAVVVGESLSNAGWRAFRWQNGVMQDLGTLGGTVHGFGSVAYGVSADGSVVVGTAYDAARQRRAFRWQNGVMQDLGTLGGYVSDAWDVSANGSVVVGGAGNAAGRYRAFRWQNGVMQDLGTLPGYHSSCAYGVSADGAVVVGVSYDPFQPRAFRWQSGVMQALDPLGVGESWAWGVSADGSVVVGLATNAAGQRRAFRWTASRGMEDLNTTYASLLTNGSVLLIARAISPDGRYIVGWGINAATGRGEAFLLDTRCTAHNGDVNRNGCVDDADLLAVLFAFGQRGSNLGRVDVNCDGVVDDADLLIVLFNFGGGC